MRWSFEKSETLKLLTKIQLEKIAQNAKINNYKVGDVIFPAGSLCDKIVIVLEGTMASSS
jgi:cGMP-dependent protein kinase